MTKEEFEVLQLDLHQSGKSIKEYLHDAGVNYSTQVSLLLNFFVVKKLSSYRFARPAGQ